MELERYKEELENFKAISMSDDLKLVKFLVENCTNIIRWVDGRWLNVWALNTDVERFWDGTEDSNLPFYTSEQILELYYKQ